MPEAKKKKLPKTVGGRFEIVKRLGAGCFGEVFAGKHVETGELVAVKFEESSVACQQLEREAVTLRMLQDSDPKTGFNSCLYYGVEAGWNCMVMELLGKSLEDRVQKCEKHLFTSKTTCLIGEQAVIRIEYLHSRGVLHRDIKPENFMFGIRERQHHVYLIDFGLSKKYWDKEHSKMQQKQSLTGTARYASINAHLGLEQSRRDDLEAISYMLMYFLRGALPWSGLHASTKEEKYRKIMEKKRDVDLNELCGGYPDAFKQYIIYSRSLEFKEAPDYRKILDLMRAVRLASGGSKRVEDHDYEWPLDPWRGGKSESKVEVSELAPLTDWRVRCRQPDQPQVLPTAAAPPVRKSGCLPCFCGRSKRVAVADDDLE